MTAEQLLARLHALGLNPTCDGVNLELTGPPPADLEPVIDILTVPLIGLLTGRPIHAFDQAGHALPGGVIDPRRELPYELRLVAVAGGEWDRISPAARHSFPHLFEPPLEKGKRPTARNLERAR